MKQHFRTGCKSFYFVALCTCLSVAAVSTLVANAQSPSETSSAPSPTTDGPLVCDQPEHDFGESDNFAKVKHTFLLRNAGDKPLTIDRILTTCGCTAATLDHKELPASQPGNQASEESQGSSELKTLAPGETVPLEVEVSLEGRQGVFQKHVYVLYDGDEQKSTRLTMKGTAIERFRFTPKSVPLGYSAADVPSEATVSIEVLDDAAKFQVKDTGTDSKYLELRVESSEDGLKHTLHARTKPPLPLGTFPATVRIFTDNERYPRLDVPVALRVVDKIEIVPDEVVLYDKGTGAPENAVRFLNVMPGSARAFAVTGVEVPVEGIATEIIPRPGNRFLIKLQNIPVGEGLEGKEVVILTDIPGRERVSVPVRVKEYPRPQASSSAPERGSTGP